MPAPIPPALSGVSPPDHHRKDETPSPGFHHREVPSSAHSYPAYPMELPIEVSEAVIDQASDDNESLCNLALTCVSFLPRSRYHLFSSIRIWDVEQMKSSRDFLDAHPWLLPLIHKVTISAEESVDHDKPNPHLLDIVPVHLLTRLPNLRVWTMGPSSAGEGWLSLHRSALSVYRRYSSHIQSLELSDISFHRFSDFTGLVSAFTSIHTFTCDTIGLLRERHPNTSLYVGGTGPLARPPQVSTLKVSF